TVKTYNCPSDFTLSNGWSGAQVGNWKGASYGANQQLFGTVRPGGNADTPQFKVGNIPDGSSNTIYFSETYSACNNNSTGNLWAYPGIAWSSSWTPVVANVRSFGVNAFLPPQLQPTLAVCDKRRSQSAHTGQVLVGLGDGSCRGVSASVTQVTW